MTKNIGPIQLLAVGFDPDARFEGRIMDELESLERHETIRILDLLFVGKDAETGDLLALDYQGEDLGAIVGALLGFEFEYDGELEGGSTEGTEGHAFGLSQSEIHDMAASLRPGSSAGFVLIEHVWARDLKEAIREAGGFPLGEGFLTPETLAEVAIELVAMSEAIEELETEEARPRRRAPGRREDRASRTNGRREGEERWDLWQHEPQTGGRRGRPTGRWRAWSGAARTSRAGWE